MAWKPYSKPLFAHFAFLCDNTFDNSLDFTKGNKMLMLSKKATEINTTQIVDKIESAVLDFVKPYGFKKHGRTLHRFVSGDISQVIHFQSGMPTRGMPTRGMKGLMCVNIGIRIPECSERDFHPVNDKKYYQEHECTLRSRLGTVSRKKETWYDLAKPTEKIISKILKEIGGVVFPAFEVLKDRKSILEFREKYSSFDTFSSTKLLDECMIYGHLDNIDKAKELFETYYKSAVNDYNVKMQNGIQYYLEKGNRIVYIGQVITAEKDGYVTLYGASHGHIDYLDELATNLGLK